MPASFAELLRRHRLTAGLTQEALAERAGLSVNGIQKLESGGTHPYRDTLRRLIQALQLTPEDLPALQAAAQPPPRLRVGDAARSLVRARPDLPTPLTSFIGREREKDELVRLLGATRLLTLTGVGGCGKTRLALEVAGLVSDGYPDGVRVVELAALADPALVPQAVAAVLGIRETPLQPLIDTLIAEIKRLRFLLLLDNCEHLLDACTQLADRLLRACPELHILATSREALGVYGEVRRHVTSLPVPPLEPPPTAEQLGAYAAVQLFVDRARTFYPGFVVTDRNAGTVAQVCARLDGIPLALELAAALVRGLSVEDIAARLDQRFRLLTGGSRAGLPRQQTLRATIDWSYELLSAQEQALFDRLSVFRGRWSLEAMEAVCTGDGTEPDRMLEQLLRLVDKSLVVVEGDPDGEHRYWLLDTLRQYGCERLVASGQSEGTQERHASYFVAVAERAEPELNGRQQAAWIERLARDQSDFRAALEWLVSQGNVQSALRLGGVLGRFWDVRSQLSEGRRTLAMLLALPAAAEPTLARAKVLDGAGVLALYQGDLPAARAMLKESLALYQQHQQPSGLAWSLIHFGQMCAENERYKAARRFLAEGLALCRQLDDRRGIARCLNALGLAAFDEGHLERAGSLYEECLALSREVGDLWGTAWALTNLGLDLVAQIELGQADVHSADFVLDEGEAIWRELGERRHLAFIHMYQAATAMWQGKLDLGRTLLDESLSTFTDLQYVFGIGNTLWVWAQLFAAHGQYEQAARVLGAASGRYQAKRRRPVFHRLFMDQRLDAARGALGAELVDAAWTEGYTMSVDAAIAYVRKQLSFESVPLMGSTSQPGIAPSR